MTDGICSPIFFHRRSAVSATSRSISRLHHRRSMSRKLVVPTINTRLAVPSVTYFLSVRSAGCGRWV